MSTLLLGAWIVQALVGLSLAVGWWRHGRRHPTTVGAHVACSVLGLAAWTTYVVTDGIAAAWGAVALITVGNGFGDEMLLRRVRHRTESTSKRRSYPVAVGALFRGQMPARVAFHALFAGVVYFGSLGVAIAATLAAS